GSSSCRRWRTDRGAAGPADPGPSDARPALLRQRSQHGPPSLRSLGHLAAGRLPPGNNAFRFIAALAGQAARIEPCLVHALGPGMEPWPETGGVVEAAEGQVHLIMIVEAKAQRGAAM